MLIEKPRIPIRSILLYGWLPGFIKIALYRLRGHRIGKGVSIGFGAVICGERIEVGDYTTIGFLTIIRGKEIRIGPFVQIGSMTFLDTPSIQIGEGTKINEQVFVGGLQDADAQFIVGRNCQIMQFSFINPARSIRIGDDSGIGGHSLIFGHSSFHNQFEGYPVDFAPIEIGNSVGLAWRVFVLPGTKIGDGTLIGANSVVSGTLPPRCMAVGYPARIVGKAPVFPKSLSTEEKTQMFRDIIQEMLRYFAGSGLACTPKETYYEVEKPTTGWFRSRKTWRLVVTDGSPAEAAATHAKRIDAFVSLLDIPDDVRTELSKRGTLWLDVARKERSRVSNDLGEEVSLFLKRYGVRTLRWPQSSDFVPAVESEFREAPQARESYSHDSASS